MPDLTLTVLVIPECPNAAPAIELARQAVAAVSATVTVRTLEVDDLAQAVRLRFTGSPSYHLDGRDLFPTGSAPAITCRLYRTLTGLRGTPDMDDLIDVLRRSVPR